MKTTHSYLAKLSLCGIFFIAEILAVYFVYFQRKFYFERYWGYSTRFSVWVMLALLVVIVLYIFYFLIQNDFFSAFYIKRKWVVFLFTVIALGAFLRLEQPFVHSIFFDEDIYLQSSEMIGKNFTTAQCSFGKFYNGKLNCLIQDNRYGALQKGYPMLLAVLFKFTGQNERAAFYFNCLLGILSILVIFFIGKELGGQGVGLMAASLLAISPPHIRWSVSTSCDVPTLFFLLSSFMIFLFSLRLKSLELFMFSLVVLTYASFMRAEIILALPIFLIFYLLEKKVSYFQTLSWANCIKICALSVLIVLNILGSLISFSSISGFVKVLFSTPKFLSISNFYSNFGIILRYHLFIKDYILLFLIFGFLISIATLFFFSKDRRKTALILSLIAIFFLFYTSLAAGAYGYDVDIATIRYSLTWNAFLILSASLGWVFLFSFFTKAQTSLLLGSIAVVFLYTFIRCKVIVPKSNNPLMREERSELLVQKDYPQCMFIVPHVGMSLFSGYSAINYEDFYQTFLGQRLFAGKRYPFKTESCLIFFISDYCKSNDICDKVFPLASWEKLDGFDIPSYKLKCSVSRFIFLPYV